MGEQVLKEQRRITIMHSFGVYVCVGGWVCVVVVVVVVVARTGLGHSSMSHSH